MAAIFIRTLAVYVVLIAVMRFSGKRQIGEMQVSELVTTFLLSNLASAPISNSSVPLLYAVVPIITLICLEVFFSFLTTKITFIKKLLDGKPSIIINKGKLDAKEMCRMRMSVEDLLCEIRIAGYASADELEYAILEPNGKFSFFPREKEKPLTKGDLPPNSLAANDGVMGIVHAVIIDGKIVEYALSYAGKSEKWVTTELKKRRVSDISEVFLMTVDDAGKINIMKRKECGA